jgi:hypothetical protein
LPCPFDPFPAPLPLVGVPPPAQAPCGLGPVDHLLSPVSTATRGGLRSGCVCQSSSRNCGGLKPGGCAPIIIVASETVSKAAGRGLPPLPPAPRHAMPEVKGAASASAAAAAAVIAPKSVRSGRVCRLAASEGGLVGWVRGAAAGLPH